MESYLNIIARLLGYDSHQEIDWGVIDKDEVQFVMEHLAQNDMAPNTSSVYLAAIKGAAKEAWVKKIIDAEHYARIKMVKANRGSRLPKGRRLTNEEVTAIFEACLDDTIIGIRDLSLLSLIAETGLRRSEAVSIKTKDLNIGKNVITITGKGNKQRLVHLPKFANKNLLNWLDFRGNESGYLYGRIRRGDTIVTTTPLSDKAVLYILERRRRMAGVLEHCAPHDLRRTFATRLFEMDVDLLTIQRAMGHSQVATTQRYDRRGDDAVSKVAQDFGYFE
jgi:site-specific recombinase XerD